MTFKQFQVIGADDRVDSAISAVCKLVYTKGGGEMNGTGFLIDSDTVITAAHCILGVDLDSMLVYPSATPSFKNPIRARFMKAYGSDPAALPSKDMGVIRLKASVALDQYISLRSLQLSGPTRVSVCGYEVNSWQQKIASGIATSNDGCVLYSLDTESGQSGGPALLANSTTAVGVHIGFPPESSIENRAASIIDDFIRFVRV